MNPRLVLHLFATDWRRLRWFLLLAWLGMLLAALPAIRFSLADLQSGIWSTAYDGSSNSEEERNALIQYLNPIRLPLSSAWSYYGSWLLPLMLAGISASLGFHGSGWARVRPLRRQERALAALAGLLAFIVLPQCTVIAVNILMHGFSAGVALDGAWRAGIVLLPLHAASLLLGRVCGSLWRWIAALAGIAVITGLLSLLPFRGYGIVSSGVFGIGWWGEFPHQSRPVLVTFAVMALVVFLFRGGNRPRWRIALVLLSVVVVPFVTGGSRYLPTTLADVPPHPQAASVRAEYLPGSLSRYPTYEANKPATLGFWINHTGLAEGEKPLWMLEKARPFSYQGKTLPHKWGWFPTWHDKDITPGGLTMQPTEVVPLPFKMPGDDDSPSSQTQAPVIGDFDLSGVSGPDPRLDLDAGLLGIVLRYREVLRVPVEDVIDLKGAGLTGGSARFIRSGLLAPAVDMSYFLGSPQKGYEPYRDSDPMKQLRCFLHLGSDRYVEGRNLHAGSRMLLSQSCAIRRIVKFGGVREDELATAKLVLVRLEITGSIHSRVTAGDLPLPPAWENQTSTQPRRYSVASWRNSWRSPAETPSAETCTEDQAGEWLMRILNSYDRSGGRYLAPFVKRFPDLFLNYPEERSENGPISAALLGGLPDGERQSLLDAFAKEPDPGRSPLLPVILQRGWQAQCRETVLRGLRNGPSDSLVAAAASYEDPSLYPLLLDAVDKTRSIQAYLAIRRLPGIEPALTRMVEAGFARDRASLGTNPDFSKLALPAIHGIREAFDLLVPPSKNRPDKHFPPALDVLAQVVSTPAEVTSWQARMDYLTAREAADFHYDSFTGFWFPNNSKHSAK